MAEHEAGVQPTVPAGGGLSQSVPGSEEVGLGGFPDVRHADVLLTVVEAPVLPQHLGALPGSPHVADGTGSPVRVSEGTGDIVNIHSSCLPPGREA